MVYTIQQLEQIGDEVASCWGAECIGFTIKYNGDVIYECVEHGEFFITTIKVEDLSKYLN